MHAFCFTGGSVLSCRSREFRESENVDSKDLSHILPGLRMMVFQQLGDITLAERIAQEAMGRGILAIARGEIRDGLPAEDFIIEIAHKIINNEIMDREA